MPRGVRPGVTVQQHHGWPRSAVPDAQGHLPHVDHLELEAVEHRRDSPRHTRRRRGGRDAGCSHDAAVQWRSLGARGSTALAGALPSARMSSLSRPPEPRRAPLASSAPAIASVLLAAASFAAWLWLAESGGGTIDVPWAPSAGLRLSFELDGLGALYALLATGIGAAVFVYAGAYVPLHLEHQGRPARDARRFFGFLVLFMGAMVGLATASDLILLFLFWDLTAVASYFLIGFDRHERTRAAPALMALLVTGVSAVLLLIGRGDAARGVRHASRSRS